MEITVHFHRGEHRHVITVRLRQQRAGLALGEHLRRPRADGAVNPHPGRAGAPGLRAGLRVGQAGEVLTGPEVPAHILNIPLYLRLVLRGPDPRGVGGEPAVLGVIQPARGETRVHRVGVGDDRRGVVGHQDPEAAAEEAPRSLAAGDERGQGLGEAQPHEHVPRVAGGEDQRMHLPPPPRHRVGQHAQVTEVQLALHPGLTVGDPHRRRRLAESAPLHAKPVQRPVGHHHAAALQQDPDLDDGQVLLHPSLDVGVTGLQLLPRQAVAGRPDPRRSAEPGRHRGPARPPPPPPHTAARSCGPPRPARPPCAARHRSARPAAPHVSPSPQPPGIPSADPPSRLT